MYGTLTTSKHNCVEKSHRLM